MEIMAAITEEGLGRAIASAMAQVLQHFQQTQGGAATATTPSPATTTSKLMHKHFHQVDKFKEPSDWREWQYQFIVAVKAASPAVGETMEKVQKLELDEITAAAIDGEVDIEDSDRTTMARSKGELFSVLTLWTKGEPNQIVRGVLDQDGFVAYKKLYDRYNPRTPASLTAAWREVIRTKKVRDLREADKTLDVWEAKVERLNKEHGETVPAGLKAALVMEMLPEGAQMTIAQGMARKIDYDALKAKIRLMASVHTEMATPKPMEVDALHEHVDCGHHGDGDWGDVQAVAKGKGRGSGPMFGSCWTCGGPHFSRECPQNTGNTKGDKGFGKGAGKGDASGKGKGKGQSRSPMYGACWMCGGPHFQAECPYGPAKGRGGKSKGKGKSLREVDEDDDGDAQDVGGVTECWSISEVVERPSRWRKVKGRKQIKLDNKFAALAEVEEVTEEKRGVDLNCTVKSEDHLETDCFVGLNCTLGQNDAMSFEDELEQHILAVTEGVMAGRGEIVVDSGAAESVCPWDWAGAFPMKAVRPGQERHFRNASGGRMAHYGEKKVMGTVGDNEAPISMVFQVSDAKNALASVARITEKGNVVQFGPEDSDNFIMNPMSGEKVALRRKGNKFILDMDFVRRA